MSSFIVDFALRQRVATQLNIFFVYQTPVPRLSESDPIFRFIVERAARLACTTPEFDDLAREVGLRGHEDGVTDPGERAQLRAELDGRIAHLYGLTEDEFAHILSTFPLVSQEAKDAALDAYRAYADTAAREAESAQSGEEALLRARIAGDETDTLEFKVGAMRNPRTNARDETMRDNVLQAVAAFLNSEQGGTVLIGVASDKTIVGIDDELPLVDARNATPDGYGLWLGNLFNDRLRPRTASLFCAVAFPTLDGKTLCRIDVRPAGEPVFLAEGKHESFYIRDNQGKRRLLPSEAWTYMRRRWSPNPAQSAAPQVDPNSGLFTPQTMLDLGRGSEARDAAEEQ